MRAARERFEKAIAENKAREEQDTLKKPVLAKQEQVVSVQEHDQKSKVR